MKHQAGEWEMVEIQKRYLLTHGLELTFLQAEQVYEYERLKTSSYNHNFSFWEELDFELVCIEKILTHEQLERYATVRAEQITLFETDLLRMDQTYSGQLEAAGELIAYYQNHLAPILERQRMPLMVGVAHEKEKVEYLKATYQRHLHDRRMEIVVNHMRHYKTFQPNLLKLSLLNHRKACLVPEYGSFRADMDNPTMVIADYLETKMTRGAELMSDNYKSFVPDLEAFQTASNARHIGEMSGWHIPPTRLEGELMSILLFDPERYDTRHVC